MVYKQASKQLPKVEVVDVVKVTLDRVRDLGSSDAVEGDGESMFDNSQ
jgi:hypothetical protein